MTGPFAAGMLVFTLLLPNAALAEVRVWDGGGADANWMTKENWVGDVAPVPGADSLEFPEVAARKINVNNFPASSVFLGIHFSGPTAGYVLSGQLVLLGGTVTSANSSGTNTVTFPITTSADGLGITVSGAGGAFAATGDVNLTPTGGTALSLGGPGAIHLAGHLQGAGGVTKSGSGVALFGYANTYTGSTTVLGGKLVVNGAQNTSAVTMTGGTLGGSGRVGPLGAYAGTVSPGASPGRLLAGSATMTQETTFSVELNGASSGSGYDVLDVSGTVSVGGARLIATLGYVPQNDAQFTIVNNDGSDPVAGTFADLPQGASFAIGGRSFTINYTGGTGNDIVLTAAPISFISGRVTMAELGTPVSGASVTIYSSTGSHVTSLNTNSQGQYRSPTLASGIYFLKAEPPSSSGLLPQLYNGQPCPDGSCTVTSGTPVTVTAPGATPDINFALPFGGKIVGLVTSAVTMAPVPNVWVSIYSSSGSFITSDFTDDEGFYTTSVGLSSGSYFVTARPLSFSVLEAQLYSGLPCPDGNCTVTNGTPVVVSAPYGTSASFVLASGGTITGLVTNADTGAPVANTTIRVYSNTGGFVSSTVTNAQGTYVANAGPTGSYFIKAEPPYDSSLLGQLHNGVPCANGNCAPTSGTPVPVTAPNATTVNFALASGVTFTGTVTNAATGAPVANSSVSIYSSTGSSVASAYTNAQGVYTTTPGLPSGAYFLKVVPPSSSGLIGELYNKLPCHNGQCTVTSGTPVSAAGANPTTINFALPVGARITGRVTNATTSAPVFGFVRFYSTNGESAGSSGTDSDGFYTSPTLLNGSYYVLADPIATDVIGQLYDNIPCPGGYCSIFGGTAVEANGLTPNIDLELVQPPAAPNDTFATALVISALSYQSIVNANAATTGAEDPIVACGSSSTLKSVWYLYTPSVDGPIAVNTRGSSYDTILSVYTGSPGSFVSAGCNDYVSGGDSALTVQGTAGVRLAILVTANSQSAGVLVLNVAGVPAAFVKIAPVNSTVTGPSAVTLSWGPSTSVQSYEYCVAGDVNSCEESWRPVGNLTAVQLSGLSSNTKYFWHVRAVNIGATTYADGSENAFWNFTTTRGPYVDLDGDHRGDVFALNMPTGEWRRELAQPDGSFASSSGSWSAGWTVVPATFDADGVTDFLLFHPVTGQWFKLLTTTIGFTVQATGTWWQGWERHVLDLDGDGRSDVFLYDPATGTWFKAISTSAGFAYVQGGWNPGWEIHPMRFNSDAFGDMFLINRTTGRWNWVLGSAGGAFSYPVSEAWYPGWKLYAGDFNGDGLSDFLLHDPPTGTYFVAFTGAAGFNYQQGGWSLGWTPHPMDLNADGLDDLFLHDPATGVWFQMIGDGAGDFGNAGGQTWSLGWSLYATDFNGDGRADLLLYDGSTGAYYQARNLVNGSFTYNGGFWSPGLTVITRTPVR